jgi:hypothetical protein
MGCQSCSDRAKASAQQYPYEAVMPDGSKVMVSSSADLRVQTQNVQARMRREAAEKGYTVTRR